MKYVVIKDFTDLQDKNHIYRVGDKYPRKGRVKNERVEELSSSANKLKTPLIKVVEEDE
ncbi:hypothetical protein HLK66_16230 [Niallia circulans]|uniref:hypothetical protein n=1 Tax=Niallia TaxID=2837506 RepID=UPI00148FAE35|nr:hypothetical protein [Niallia circulans]QJX62986.1 hypothetical protein HLK66_15860 [Niallia circulans]QJX63052.1 hypothetical protein HLK66_16230 [Niallia circulans]